MTTLWSWLCTLAWLVARTFEILFPPAPANRWPLEWGGTWCP
jgi:hypothetical protein